MAGRVMRGGRPRLLASGTLGAALIVTLGVAAQPVAATAAASWSVQPSPGVRPYSALLTGVAATSASNAWAVGEYWNTGTGRTLTEHWNGQRWAIQPSPNVGTAELNGVAATSASNAWAVGASSLRTLIEHWNGQRWSVLPSPSLGSQANVLYSIAATSAASAWAVGSHVVGSTSRALILYYH